MRVLIAGSTGVLGRQLVPVLQGAGHDVAGLISKPRAEKLDHETFVANALDQDALLTAVKKAKPDAVIHMMTAIPPRLEPRKFAKQFELTNRLRTEGTRNLLKAAGGARIISQGVAFAYQPGAGLANEDTPLWTDAQEPFGTTVRALQSLEDQTIEANGLVLRFGHLYGPATSYDKTGSVYQDVLKGKMPLVGESSSVFSFTHTRDAAMAVLTALDKPITGALNIVDDDPATIAEWLPAFAKSLNAPKPRKVPVWLARIAAGSFGVSFFTQLRGADNTRARLMLDWRPGYRSWTEGLLEQR